LPLKRKPLDSRADNVPLWAQEMSDIPTQSPETVVAEALEAFALQRWAHFASLIHPDALAEFRDQQLLFVQAWEQTPTHDRPRRFPGNPVLQEFPGVQSIEAFMSLSPSDLFARHLAAHAPASGTNYASGKPPVWTRAVIGTVQEHDTLAHVVYRKEVEVWIFGATEETHVVTVKRHGNEWRLLLNQDLSMIGSVRITRHGPPLDDTSTAV
jgi:hypothetical protein